MAAKLDVTSGYADVNGARLYFETAGEGDTLVFVHAGIADRRLWDHQFSVFARDHLVVRYDLRGFGLSSLRQGAFSHTRDLYALLSLLGIEQAVLVGCSIGGEISLDYTLSYPNRVRGLVMVCSMPRGLPWDDAVQAAYPDPPQAGAIEAAFKAGDLEQASELEVQLFVDGASRRPDQVDPAVRRLVQDMNLIALQNEAATRDAQNSYQHEDAAEHLATITAPVLVVTGALDEPVTTDYAAGYMLAHLPNAQQAVIEDTAHVPSLERPDVFNRVLADWLAKLG